MSCNDNQCFQPERPPIKMEIDCFKLEKVFEECSKTFVAKVKIPLKNPQHAHKIKCVNAHIHPRELDCKIDEERSKILIKEDQVMVNLKAKLIDDYNVYPLHAMGLLEIPEENMEFALQRAGEPGFECQVEIFAECLECHISCKDHDDLVSEITCCIGILIIAKLTAKVQVRIPSFGFCPVPERCEEARACHETYEPQEIPYPKQKKEHREKEKECREKEKEHREKECREKEKDMHNKCQHIEFCETIEEFEFLEPCEEFEPCDDM